MATGHSPTTLDQLLSLLAPEYDPVKCSDCNHSHFYYMVLPRCSACRETTYCGLDCQASHWRHSHGGYECEISAVRNNRFLDLVRPVRETYHYIIDVYRLRVYDDYKLGGTLHGLPAAEDPIHDFERRFLDSAESLTIAQKYTLELLGDGEWNRHGRIKCGVLPTWWNPDHRRECEIIAVDLDNEYSILKAVDVMSIAITYNDATMPLKLRMIATKIYGTKSTSLQFHWDCMLKGNGESENAVWLSDFEVIGS